MRLAWASLALVAIVGCGGGERTAPPPPATAKVENPAPAVVAPAPPKVPSFAILPAEATLGPEDPGIQYVVVGRDARDGEPGLLKQVAFSVSPAGAATVGADGYLVPLKSGPIVVTAQLGEDKVDAKVQIDSRPRGWSFAEDIAPRLTRAGCNAGGCHAKADGQNGFHLSLFGYDYEGDYRSLTRGADARRLSRVSPDHSLFLRKALGIMPHGGGRRINPGSDDHKILREWIAAGTPYKAGTDHGALTSIAVEPGDARLDAPGPLQLRVVAAYADGHRRDVTRLSSFRSNDDSTLAVDAVGRAELLRRAEADLVVRYQNHVTSVRLATVINPDLNFDFAALPRRNVIDEELFKRLESLKVPPSPPADDATFLRRASIDLTGQPPTPAAVRKYIDDKSPDKKIKLVDALMKTGEFRKLWKIRLGDLLQITSARFANTSGRYEEWLDAKLARNDPWDVMVRELLTTLGDPRLLGNGAANYALDAPDAKAKSERTAQRFLGLRLRCAQCHDHPFDTWTQDDYHGFAAIFAKAEPAGGTMMEPDAAMMQNRIEIVVNPKGSVEHPRTRQPAPPRLLDGTKVEVAESEDPRRALADWVTRPDNPFFARAAANWAWAQFFGRGIAEPADDLSRSNPPVHPELLDGLARQFVEAKFDLRALIRTIVTSEAYGLASATVPGNERDARLFSHHQPRPLTAHQMADALAAATGVANRFSFGNTTMRGDARRAIDVFDPAQPSAILDTFGRCPRVAGCAAAATPSLSLRQSLLVIGGTVVEDKVSAHNGYITSALELGPTPKELVENLYLRALCRPPTAEESAHWAAELSKAAVLQEAAEDLFWALLNSKEFAFNH